MGDSFNAQEILAKLRAKSNTSNGDLKILTDSPTSSRQRNSTKTQATKIIKAPSSLTLTPSQRQDNLNIRIELEKDIKALQDEVLSLKAENKQLRSDKEDVEKMFIEYKVKAENNVVKLRGKLAAMSLGVYASAEEKGPLSQSQGSAGGKIYPTNPPPAPPQGQMAYNANYKRGGTPLQMHPYLKSTSPISGNIHSSSGNGNNHPSFTSGRSPQDMFNPAAAVSQQESLGLGTFRDPTFSELMRRSTHENPGFTETLRHSGPSKRIPVQQPAHNSASKLPPKQLSSSGGGGGTAGMYYDSQQQYLQGSPQYTLYGEQQQYFAADSKSQYQQYQQAGPHKGALTLHDLQAMQQQQQQHTLAAGGAQGGRYSAHDHSSGATSDQPQLQSQRKHSSAGSGGGSNNNNITSGNTGASGNHDGGGGSGGGDDLNQGLVQSGGGVYQGGYHSHPSSSNDDLEVVEIDLRY